MCAYFTFPITLSITHTIHSIYQHTPCSLYLIYKTTHYTALCTLSTKLPTPCSLYLIYKTTHSLLSVPCLQNYPLPALCTLSTKLPTPINLPTWAPSAMMIVKRCYSAVAFVWTVCKKYSLCNSVIATGRDANELGFWFVTCCIEHYFDFRNKLK